MVLFLKPYFTSKTYHSALFYNQVSTDDSLQLFDITITLLQLLISIQFPINPSRGARWVPLKRL